MHNTLFGLVKMINKALSCLVSINKGFFSEKACFESRCVTFLFLVGVP